MCYFPLSNPSRNYVPQVIKRFRYNTSPGNTIEHNIPRKKKNERKRRPSFVSYFPAAATLQASRVASSKVSSLTVTRLHAALAGPIWASAFIFVVVQACLAKLSPRWRINNDEMKKKGVQFTQINTMRVFTHIFSRVKIEAKHLHRTPQNCLPINSVPAAASSDVKRQRKHACENL